MSRLVVIFLWCFHWLPLPLQAACGNALGWLLYWVVAPRRRVTLTNLRLCFPDLSERARARMARQHFMYVARSFLERGVLWFASADRIRRLVRVEGLEHLKTVIDSGTPAILLVPHFCALDAAGTRLATEVNWVSIYSSQKNKVLERWLLHGRTRFGNQVLFSRQEGVRPVIKKLREGGYGFFYLPDQDFGPRDSIFVPFFGVQAATVPGLPRIARMARAQVLSGIIRMMPWGRGYELTIGAPWEDFPGDDEYADTLRMNQELERHVLTMPAQYYWVHKRFKTRPEGEPGFY
ncbi:lipid A biosynthesis lauroyl acyltransferase [Niveibacterium umoris]|uniref:KDO2-lipid IV(A) lauroyltransferase n=1 Tax=Niveibacterium umoris TaxID=1193620 RepID=A0A840BI12_9RHOO|nr:lipid A biosynthesis acyltransferase [Niveibacterium umoris]MBB4013191.1 KDO2-lipid IV(A) lauroyltransferase [Niveibacterium umoris]